MTQPRLIEPGTYHSVSRRCVARKFLLRPDPDILNLFAYVFAVGSERFGVQVVRLVIMSNHYHGTFYDRDGRLPDFLTWVHRMLALGIQHLRGVSGAVFERTSTSDQIIASDEAFWKVMAYQYLNPVSAGLVPHGHKWPGCLTPVGVTARAATRPANMTHRTGPKHAVLRIHRAEHFIAPAVEGAEAERGDEAASLRHQQYDRVVQGNDQRAEQELHQALKQANKFSFKGLKKAMAIDPEDAPKTQPKRGRSPQWVAVTQVAIVAIEDKLKAFYQAYRRAYDQFVAGKRDVAFPEGTWKMVHCLGCCGPG